MKLEERKIPKEESPYIFQDILSTSSAILKKIVADSGVIVKMKDDYVKPGDVVISGKIYKNDELMDLVKASGKIYGEVWYNVRVEFPIALESKEYTKNKQSLYVVKLFSNVFTFGKSYEYKEIKIDGLLYDRLLGFGIYKQTEYELIKKSGIYSVVEAMIEASCFGYKKVNDTLNDDEYVISSKVLNYYSNFDKVNVEMFFKVYKNITGVKEIFEE